MKMHLFLPICLFVLLPIEMNASTSCRLNSACESFESGEVNAIETLEALDLNIYDYSIGLNNVAKIFCA